MVGWMDGWTDRWTDGQMDGQMDTGMDRRMDRHTDARTDGWTDRRIDKMMDGQTGSTVMLHPHSAGGHPAVPPSPLHPPGRCCAPRVTPGTDALLGPRGGIRQELGGTAVGGAGSTEGRP